MRVKTFFLWIMLLGCLVSCGQGLNRTTEPAGSIPTADYHYAIKGNQLLAEKDNMETVIFQGDRNASVLQLALAPKKLYLLCDDTLYSMNADGSDQYQVAGRCYNPVDGEEPLVAESTAEALGTVRYYDGFVYFVKYGNPSTLCRFQCGGTETETLAENQVSAFYISEDGVLHGYSGRDNSGSREETLVLPLTE